MTKNMWSQNMAIFPLLFLFAFTTACTAVQAMIIVISGIYARRSAHVIAIVTLSVCLSTQYIEVSSTWCITRRSDVSSLVFEAKFCNLRFRGLPRMLS